MLKKIFYIMGTSSFVYFYVIQLYNFIKKEIRDKNRCVWKYSAGSHGYLYATTACGHTDHSKAYFIDENKTCGHCGKLIKVLLDDKNN